MDLLARGYPEDALVEKGKDSLMRVADRDFFRFPGFYPAWYFLNHLKDGSNADRLRKPTEFANTRPSGAEGPPRRQEWKAIRDIYPEEFITFDYGLESGAFEAHQPPARALLLAATLAMRGATALVVGLPLVAAAQSALSATLAVVAGGPRPPPPVRTWQQARARPVHPEQTL